MKLCDVILGPKRSFLTTAWRLLLSRMQWAAGAERRWLRIYWDRTDGTSTLGLMAVGPYRKSYTEYTKIGQMAHPPWDWRQLVHIGRVTQNILRSDRWHIHLGTDGSWSISEELHRIPDCWEHSREAVGCINGWEFFISLKFSKWPDSPSWCVLILRECQYHRP